MKILYQSQGYICINKSSYKYDVKSVITPHDRLDCLGFIVGTDTVSLDSFPIEKNEPFYVTASKAEEIADYVIGNLRSKLIDQELNKERGLA